MALVPVAAPGLAPSRRDRTVVRSALGIGDGLLVLAVSRPRPQQGLDVLIRAAAGWRDRSPVVSVATAGDGPSYEELAAPIRATGAPVRFLGRRDDVTDPLAAADVVVLPSR